MNPRLERIRYLLQEDTMQILQQATVAVIGVGGVGGVACESLIRSGVGNLIIMDHDTVHISNSNRQIIAMDSTIGSVKVEVLKSRLQDIAPEANITVYPEKFQEETKEELFQQKIDFLIDAIDSIPDKFLLIKEAISRNIPIVSSMGAAKKLSPLGIEISTLDKTTYDPIAKILRKKLRDENITTKVPVVYSKESPQAIPNLGSYMNVTASFGLLCAHVALTELCKKGGKTKCY